MQLYEIPFDFINSFCTVSVHISSNLKFNRLKTHVMQVHCVQYRLLCALPSNVRNSFCSATLLHKTQPYNDHQ